jgi:hypothetical protein
VIAICSDHLQLKIIEYGFSTRVWPLADVRLQLKAEWQQAPRLNGANVVEVSAANASVRAQDVLAYSTGATTWAACRVEAVEGDRVKLNGSITQGGEDGIPHPAVELGRSCGRKADRGRAAQGEAQCCTYHGEISQHVAADRGCGTLDGFAGNRQAGHLNRRRRSPTFR